MDKDSEIFKIKPIGNKNIVVEDKRKTISPFNSAKHFKAANIPALCDQCVYKSIEAGGNGKCPKYEEGAVCAIREDFLKFINELDTRNPEDLKAMIDMIAKISFENVLMALTQAKMDGNIPDRNTKSEIKTLLEIVKSINDLNSKITVTEQKEFNKEGDISNIFRQIKSQKSG
jgi:hypothetical protein|tara:strand:- start:3513 stop:4031 length:519 start_codon:yes stop_codon:yes gene_type:complete